MSIRAKWDKLFIESGKYRIIMRILCAVVCFISAYKMLGFYASFDEVPYPQIIDGQMKMLIPAGCALLGLAAPKLGSSIIALLLFVVYGGSAPVILVAAAFIMFMEAVSGEVVSSIILAAAPIIMFSGTAWDGSTPKTAIFLFFALLIFFAAKTDAGIGYASFVWFTFLAFVSGIITVGETVMDIHDPSMWIIGTFPAEDFEKGVQQCENLLLSLVIFAALAMIICFIADKLMTADIKQLLMLQLDIREAIAFAVMAVLMIAMMYGMGFIEGVEIHFSIVRVIAEVAGAYLITRPFASYKAASALSRENQYEAAAGTQLVTGDVVRTTDREIQGIADTLANEKSFNKILFTGNKPVKNIMIYGHAEANKKYVLERSESKINQKIEYLEAKDLVREVAEKGEIAWAEEKGVPRCYFINHFDSLFDGDAGRRTAECILNRMDEKEDDHETMFILGADNPEQVPDECFGEKRIARVIHAKLSDSIIYNDSYAILDVIGKGGFGDVFSAWHMRLNEKVVLKKVSVDKPSAVSGKHEVELLKRLKHMYLPKIYDVFDANQAVYLVTDFVPGKSFADYLKEGKRFDQKHVLKWGMQLSEAVGYLHNMQPPIIHSDIKPGNIMLTPDGDICLIDFNISAILDGDSAKSVGTTPGYSPIEQYGFVQNYLNLLAKRGVNVDAFSRMIVRKAGGDGAGGGQGASGTSANTSPTGAISNSIPVSDSVQSAPGAGARGMSQKVSDFSATMDNGSYADNFGDEFDEDETVPANLSGGNLQDDETLPADLSGSYSGNVQGSANNSFAQGGQGAGTGIDAKTFLVDCMQKGYGTRSDIYAIGATLYHLVTGAKPKLNFFATKPAKDYADKVSPEFAAVIDKCMSIDPDERYQTVAELQNALAKVRE